MSIKKQLAHSSVWTIAGSVINNISSFLVFAVLARILTPVEFGIVAFATIFLEIGRTCVVAGISDALVQRADWDQKVATAGFWLNFGFGILVSFILKTSSLLFEVQNSSGQFAAVLTVLSIDLIIEGLTAVHVAKLRRTFDYKSIAKNGAIGRIFSGIIGIGLALNG